MAEFFRAPIGPGYDENDKLKLVIARLNEAQSNLAQIIDVLNKIITTLTSSKSEPSLADIRKTISDHRTSLATNHKQVSEAMEKLKEIRADDTAATALTAYIGDLVDIEELWEHITQAYPEDFPNSLASKSLSRIVTCRTMYEDLHKTSVLFTVPKTIKGLVQERRPGSPYDFHKEFKREISDPAIRVALLEDMADVEPTHIGGMVDLQAGIIYSISKQVTWRILSSLVLVLLGFVGWFIVDALSVNGAAWLSWFSKEQGWNGFDGGAGKSYSRFDLF
ncbi:MAG TPA: hypothetical protein VJ183_03625 [Chloroflexia bacterium]|nr:hypothetical protein [Chloroflexia bacterium]